MKLITGYQLEDHVTSMHDAMWHRGIWKDDCIISVGENLKAEIISNNEIRVRSGILNMQGKFCSIDMNTYDSLTINNGTTGENRIDLIVARYEKNNETQVEDVSLKVIQGTPSTSTPSVPSYTEGNIDNGDLVAELSLYEVHIEGINITEVKRCLNIVPSLSQINRNLLFQGAINSGTLTLNDSANKYKELLICYSSAKTTSTYDNWSRVLIFPESKPPTTSNSIVISSFENNQSGNVHVTVIGRIIIDGNTIEIFYPIKAIKHYTQGENGHGQPSTAGYYIRQVWGVR